LGGKGWQRLHRLIYITAIAAVVHYYWLVKSDIRLPLLYGALVALELTYRLAVSKSTQKMVKVSSNAT
jgi:sulfoxide reductase heme-binding subunit YedZ